MTTRYRSKDRTSVLRSETLISYYGEPVESHDSGETTIHLLHSAMKDVSDNFGNTPCRHRQAKRTTRGIDPLFTVSSAEYRLFNDGLLDSPAGGHYFPASVAESFITPILGDGPIDAYMQGIALAATASEHVARWKKLKFVSNDPEFDLPVFLAELKEVKKTLPGLLKHLNTLKKAFKRASSHRARLATVGDLFAGLWLDWSFGTGAFIRDLVKLHQLFCNMQGKYEKFIKGMGVPVNANHRISLDNAVPLPRDYRVTYNLVGRVARFTILHRLSPPTSGKPDAASSYSVLCASYRYWSAAMSGPFGRAKFIGQQLGLVADPAIPWNLIPLSFVLDWFIPIGSWLSKFRIDLMDVNVTVDSATYGSRAAVEREIYLEYDGAPKVLLCSHIFSRYQRVDAKLYPTPKTIEFGGISMNKVLSGSSLFWSIVVRGSRK